MEPKATLPPAVGSLGAVSDAVKAIRVSSESSRASFAVLPGGAAFTRRAGSTSFRSPSFVPDLTKTTAFTLLHSSIEAMKFGSWEEASRGSAALLPLPVPVLGRGSTGAAPPLTACTQ